MGASEEKGETGRAYLRRRKIAGEEVTCAGGSERGGRRSETGSPTADTEGGRDREREARERRRAETGLEDEGEIMVGSFRFPVCCPATLG